MNINTEILEELGKNALLRLALVNAFKAKNKTIMDLAKEFKELGYPARWSVFVGWISKRIEYVVDYTGDDAIFEEITVHPIESIEEE